MGHLVTEDSILVSVKKNLIMDSEVLTALKSHTKLKAVTCDTQDVEISVMNDTGLSSETNTSETSQAGLLLFSKIIFRHSTFLLFLKGT